ncbi:MAG: alpha/beta fold hydrolase [Spirochaetales bacterium]|nr:alpha/beta fold hydrolase [Spirochaetales bacterium]
MKNFALFVSLPCVLMLGEGCGAGPPGQKECGMLAREMVDHLVREHYDEVYRQCNLLLKNKVSKEAFIAGWEGFVRPYGTFRNVLNEESEVTGEFRSVYITCQFEAGAIDVKITFTPRKTITSLTVVPAYSALAYVPPDYVKTGFFEEKEVIVETAGWKLPGTLTVPRGKGPFPGLVLVHGSGPNDRDETVGPNKPFRDIAWGCASNGIAVLRYEKRTKHYGAILVKEEHTITVMEETIADAIRAAALLRGEEKIVSDRVFLLGHSLGGMLAPRIGSLDKEIAGFIIMAGPTRKLEDIILEQTAYLARLDGMISEDDKKKIGELETAAELIKSEGLAPDTPKEKLMGLQAAYWLDLRDYRPIDTAKRISRPLLILQGARDYQVTVEDFNAWKASLGGKENVGFRLYERLNHLFMSGEGKSTPQEYQTPGHVDRAVIDDICEWISRHKTGR